VIRDKAGNLYGTATYGGLGCGTVFELRKTSSGWKPVILWQFGAGKGDGCEPTAALNMDASGALYGNTLGGGPDNAGTIFRISPPASGSSQWSESTIWSFSDKDGAYPSTQMIFDPAGNLYGTANGGGAYGYGTVWELSPPSNSTTDWTRTILWSFYSADGRNPTRGPLARDTAGNLYGTCHYGGHAGAGYGTVFMLSPPTSAYGSWTLKTLWAFTGGPDGSNPTSGVLLSQLGDLFGVTLFGDAKSRDGTVFVLHPPAPGRTAWTLQSLWQFKGSDGAEPQSPVLREKLGVIYGSTSGGGTNGDGTIWELKP
jgi:uncharacterized repeat protein (TIGR03803 family)